MKRPANALDIPTAAHPDDAYGYNGVAYIANPQISLGTDPNLPNVNWEVVAIGAQSVSAKPMRIHPSS